MKNVQISKRDSYAFFSIPMPGLESAKYRNWIDETIITGWLIGKEGRQEYKHMSTGGWNEMGGISGVFGSRYIPNCKFYKLDREDFRGRPRRGILIRDHYSEEDVEKVMFLADRFESYLKEQKVKFKREHLRRN